MFCNIAGILRAVILLLCKRIGNNNLNHDLQVATKIPEQFDMKIINLLKNCMNPKDLLNILPFCLTFVLLGPKILPVNKDEDEKLLGRTDKSIIVKRVDFTGNFISSRILIFTT